MKDPPLVSSLNPDMPKALDPVVAKLLAKDRDQRYRSAEELQADLEAISGTGSARAAARPDRCPSSAGPEAPAGSRPAAAA